MTVLEPLHPGRPLRAVDDSARVVHRDLRLDPETRIDTKVLSNAHPQFRARDGRAPSCRVCGRPVRSGRRRSSPSRSPRTTPTRLRCVPDGSGDIADDRCRPRRCCRRGLIGDRGARSGRARRALGNRSWSLASPPSSIKSSPGLMMLWSRSRGSIEEASSIKYLAAYTNWTEHWPRASR